MRGLQGILQGIFRIKLFEVLKKNSSFFFNKLLDCSFNILFGFFSSENCSEKRKVRLLS